MFFLQKSIHLVFKPPVLIIKLRPVFFVALSNEQSANQRLTKCPNAWQRLKLHLTVSPLHSMIFFLILYNMRKYMMTKDHNESSTCRELLPASLRVPVCAIDGILSHSDLHPCLPHRCHFLGQLLVTTTTALKKSQMPKFRAAAEFMPSKLENKRKF